MNASLNFMLLVTVLVQIMINVADFIDDFKEENCGFVADRLTSKGSAEGKEKKARMKQRCQ